MGPSPVRSVLCQMLNQKQHKPVLLMSGAQEPADAFAHVSSFEGAGTSAPRNHEDWAWMVGVVNQEERGSGPQPNSWV